ncbi:MAG: hypothetical protein ACJAWV_003246 [Flammeovirgaceae bacterium]|jgi:hypothetical protein
MLPNCLSAQVVAKDVINSFISKCGGIDNWSQIDYLTYRYSEMYENDSSQLKHFVGSYKSQPICYAKHSELVSTISYEKNIFYREGDEEWIYVELPQGIRYEEISPSLEFAALYDSLEFIFTVSDINFGDKYDVIQQKISSPENYWRGEIDQQNLYLFSKVDSLLNYTLHMEGDRIVKIVSYSDYKQFDGYLFPTSRVLNPNNLDILKNQDYNYQFRNEVDGIRKPRYYLYTNIKFNHYIDEAVFLLD